MTRVVQPVRTTAIGPALRKSSQNIHGARRALEEAWRTLRQFKDRPDMQELMGDLSDAMRAVENAEIIVDHLKQNRATPLVKAKGGSRR